MNTELRDILGTDQPAYGLAQAGFRRKTQTAIHAKNEALRAAAAKDSESQKVTKTLPSGRQETVITKRTSLPATRVSLEKERGQFISWYYYSRLMRVLQILSHNALKEVVVLSQLDQPHPHNEIQLKL